MNVHRPLPVPPAAREPRAYLVPRTRPNAAREWPVALPDRGLFKVTGAPGSGVSSFLLDTASEAIRRHAGDGGGGVLVLTDSKETGARLRSELSDTLAASGFVADEPVVRSVHSLAFALVRQQLDAELRLISGAEQDAVIRQLLQGHAEDGGGSWPPELRPALPMVGFARQLRDFLLRAIERGLGPEDLARLGQAHEIGIWSASGDFLREYQQVMALSGAHRMSASELVVAALEAELPRRWHTVIVDDAQHLAPASAELVMRLLRQAELGVVGGDTEQSVFRFRGASPAFFRNLGGLEHEVIDLGATRRTPVRSAAIADSSGAELALVADELRRAHLEDDVEYRDMAVVVRSTPQLEPVRRALLRAGVPVALNPTDLVLGEQRIVAALILGVRALYEELTAAQWRDLLLSPVGGADPVTLRRLLRGLRRWAPQRRAEESLQELLISPAELPDFGTALTDRELDILRRVRGVLDAGRAALANGGSVEDVLWALWHATGLSNRLMAAALRGGATGSQADRDLDSVMALFDAAGDYTERRPTAGIESFVASIAEQELPTGVRDRRNATPDAVALLTAHGAAGREFRRVIVAGVQELTWPSLGETGSLFRQEDLVDLIDERVDPAVPVSHVNERLVEERRLFTVATSRATERLLVVAVDSDDGEEVEQRSRFVEEFCRDYAVEARPVRIAGSATDAAQATGENRDARPLTMVKLQTSRWSGCSLTTTSSQSSGAWWQTPLRGKRSVVKPHASWHASRMRGCSGRHRNNGGPPRSPPQMHVFPFRRHSPRRGWSSCSHAPCARCWSGCRDSMKRWTWSTVRWLTRTSKPSAPAQTRRKRLRPPWRRAGRQIRRRSGRSNATSRIFARCWNGPTVGYKQAAARSSR
ncbi:ATP-dependent helicase [Corynebacterium wankanglinii]|nr:ATP-dependent helicase [Corynebacterium wankanglinii]